MSACSSCGADAAVCRHLVASRGMSGCCGACAVGDTHADYGTREITPEDRKRAVIRELINSEPVLHITPGMWRAVGTPARRLSWWRRLLSGRRS